MPLSNFTRPSIPYANAPLPNDNRFNIITRVQKKPITPEQLDGEFNKLTDNDNILDQKIEDVVAGIIPGSENPLNAGKFVTTDGAPEPTLSFVFVTNNNVEDGALSGTKITPLTIGTNQLDNGIITPDKVPNGSMPYSKMNFDDGVIPGNKIFIKSITQGQLALLSVGSPELINDAVITAKIADSNITTAKIADSNVTTAKIADSNITTAKIADSNVTTAKIADSNITTAKIADNNVTTPKIADSNITTAKIADNAITNQKLENAGQMVPFAMGYISEAAVMLKQKNIASVVLAQTGEFNITFSTPASNANYIVSPGLEAGDNRTIVIYNGTKTTNGFTIRTFAPNGALASQKFNFIVYSF